MNPWYLGCQNASSKYQNVTISKHSGKFSPHIERCVRTQNIDICQKRIKNIILFVLLFGGIEKPSYLCIVKRLIDCLG